MSETRATKEVNLEYLDCQIIFQGDSFNFGLENNFGKTGVV